MPAARPAPTRTTHFASPFGDVDVFMGDQPWGDGRSPETAGGTAPPQPRRPPFRHPPRPPPRPRPGRRSEVQTGPWLATATGRRDWLHARRYAGALQSSRPLPVIDGLPMRLASHENATLRTIATYGRRYPAHPTAQWGDRHSASVVGTTDR